jgi:hypothetical protein
MKDNRCVQCAEDRLSKVKIRRYKTDPEFRQKIRDKASEYYQKNRGACDASVAQYKLSKEQRIPPWADLDKIKEIYREAVALGLTVDHEIPLRGRNVSGFHVENNLRIIPKSVNSAKGNKYVP